MSDFNSGDLRPWQTHVVRTATHYINQDDQPDANDHSQQVEPWLSALFQADHLNLLVGSGLTTAIADAAGAPVVDMRLVSFQHDYSDAVTKAAETSARHVGRGSPNVEDQIRAASELICGLRIQAAVAESGPRGRQLPKSARRLLPIWENALDSVLDGFLGKVLDTERGIRDVLSGTKNEAVSDCVRRLLGGFLLPFASRATTRERLHIFTTNYDRLIEYGADLLGLRVIDRFVGYLAPVFHSSRLGVDLHYNPPGIRGEPRHLEGVVRFTKLHGSLDWRGEPGPSGGHEVQKCMLPFGAPNEHSEVPLEAGKRLLIYPNPAKDVETLEYPYAELFRDFASAACQPNAVMVTYGYGFGDDHVNRVLRDMLSIPSTHLVIISYDHAGGRIQTFCDRAGRGAQITLLIGAHFGQLKTLVDHYLPKPALDRTTWRMVDILKRREVPMKDRASPEGDDGEGGGF